MHTRLRAAVAALAALALAGCVVTPYHRAIKPEVNTVLQPIDVRIGIAQTALHPIYLTSNSAADASCMSGGIFVSVVCGAVAVAVDSAINAKRARESNEIFAPLLPEVVDIRFDPMMFDALTQSFKGAPDIKTARIDVTKDVNNPAYEGWYRASTANGVMISNLKYHLSFDYSAVVVSARTLVYPRSPAARAAANQPAALPPPSPHLLLVDTNAVYRRDLYYVAKLPNFAPRGEDYIAAWKADGARGYKVDLLSESHGGRLQRYPNGDLEFVTTLAEAPAPAKP